MKVSASNQARRDRLWLKARRGGLSAVGIARRWHVSVKTIHNGIERARLLERPVGAEHRREPRLEPLSPITPLTPRSECPHRGPIRKGSCLVCLVCHQSGLDHLPLFRRRPGDPKPERKPAGKPERPQTRRERRSKAVA